MFMSSTNKIDWLFYLNNPSKNVELQEKIVSLIDTNKVYIVYEPLQASKLKRVIDKKKKYLLQFFNGSFTFYQVVTFPPSSIGGSTWHDKVPDSIPLKNGQYIPTTFGDQQISWSLFSKFVCVRYSNGQESILDAALYQFMFSKEIMERILDL